MVSIKASPASALVDEDVAIVICGLAPHQTITMVAVLYEEKIKMMSHAHYKADAEGIVDVTKMPSLGGSYEGVEPMAFIWAMKIAPDQPYGTRLMKRIVKTPIKIHIKVFNGQLQVQDPENIHSECLAEVKLERWYISEDVERIEIRRGRLMATLFVPKGKGPYPGVLDMFGTIGGLVEYRASLLASRGFITLSLAYFWPGTGVIQDLEYFEEATDIILSHPKVYPGSIGVIGVSKGAEFAQLLSAVTDKVGAVVAINGAPFLTGFDITYKDATFKHLEGIENYYRQTEAGICFQVDKVDDLRMEGYHIPVEKSKAKHLLIHGSDDGDCPPCFADVLPQRMVECGRPAEDCRLAMYKDAGHLIEPPYSPLFRESWHKMFNNVFIWGGRPKAHALAQNESWNLIQNFLRATLSSPIRTQSRL